MPLSLQDRFEIQDLMNRYAYGIDVDCTEEEFLDLFTEDAQMISPYSGVHEGVEGVKLFRSKFVPRRGKLQIRHVITNFLIDGDGDVAHLKAYFLEFKTQLELPPNTERKTEFFFGGSYDCDIRRVGGKWKMKRRTVFIDHLS
jgi:hypothetical protein